MARKRTIVVFHSFSPMELRFSRYSIASVSRENDMGCLKWTEVTGEQGTNAQIPEVSGGEIALEGTGAKSAFKKFFQEERHFPFCNARMTCRAPR